MRKRLLAGTAGPIELTLWHYSFGKPREHVTVSNPDGSGRGYDLTRLTADALHVLTELLAPAALDLAATEVDAPEQVKAVRADAEAIWASTPNPSPPTAPRALSLVAHTSPTNGTAS